MAKEHRDTFQTSKVIRRLRNERKQMCLSAKDYEILSPHILAKLAPKRIRYLACYFGRAKHYGRQEERRGANQYNLLHFEHTR